jgi:hypothetical protein
MIIEDEGRNGPCVALSSNSILESTKNWGFTDNLLQNADSIQTRPTPAAEVVTASPSAKPSATGENPLSETSIRQFIERHLTTVEKHNVEAYMSAYNDRVKWYGKGFVTSDYVRADIGSFFHKWNDIKYKIVGPIHIDALSDVKGVRASYPITIRTSSEKTGRNSEISGAEFVEIHVVDGLLKIFAENQEIVGRS